MRWMLVRHVFFLSVGVLLVVLPEMWAQAPSGGPTVEEQLKQLTRLIDTQYERVLREKVLLGTDMPLADPGAKVFRLTEQLRVTTQQCRNREDEAYQLMRFKDGQIAKTQLDSQEQATLIQSLRAQVESLEKALQSKAEAPAASGGNAPGAVERTSP